MEQTQEAAWVFWRIVRNAPPVLEDFETQEKRGTPPPDSDDTEALFSWEHGVSVTNTKQQALKKARGLRGRLGRYGVGVRVEAEGPVRYLKSL